MLTQEILDYVKNQKASGASPEQIAQALKDSGWPEADIHTAIYGQTPSLAPTTIQNQKLPPAKEILKESWIIYKERFWTLISISIVPALIMLVIALIAGGGLFFTSKFKVNIFATFGMWGILILIFFIALIYISIWSAAAGLFAIKDHQEKIGFTEAFNRSRKYISPLFVTGLLTGLAVFGGLLLLIIPGILFMLWFSQSAYVVINENLSGSKAMSRSKAYVQGRIGEIFGKYFYIIIILFLAGFILGIIDTIIFKTLGTNPEKSFGLSNVFSIIIGPLSAVYYFRVYKYLNGTPNN